MLRGRHRVEGDTNESFVAPWCILVLRMSGGQDGERERERERWRASKMEREVGETEREEGEREGKIGATSHGAVATSNSFFFLLH